MAVAIIAGTVVTQKLFRKNELSIDAFDLLFFALIPAIIGARLYYVSVYFDRFLLRNTGGDVVGFDFLEAIDLRTGGIGIFGAILGGILGVYIFYRLKVRKPKKLATIDNSNLDTDKILKENKGLADNLGGILTFYQFLVYLVPGLALGQSIGRWGNYFNQELYGEPTDLPWGIYIEPENRREEYLDEKYFHPVFLYESILNLIFFLFAYFSFGKVKQNLLEMYIVWYGAVRFLMEMLRTNETADIFGFRFESVLSLSLIALGLTVFAVRRLKNKTA
jgi:phosphatidylglycerol:prolipoprotein diacylglycerol transferase